MSNLLCSQGICSCHLTRDSGLMLPTPATSTLLSLQARVVFAATVLPNATFPFLVHTCAWCVRQLGGSWQGHRSERPATLSLVSVHQPNVKIAIVLCRIGYCCCPSGMSQFERRRTQVSSQHRSLLAVRLVCEDSHLPGKASTPPSCTTIRFPNSFSVQLLIPVTVRSRFCFSFHCKWIQKATHRPVLSCDAVQ